MDIDEVYTEIGEFGSFQKKIFWSFGFFQVVLALHQIHNVFIGATPSFYCRRGTGKDVVTISGCPADGGQCDSYTFAGDDFTSIVSEWDLVCDKAYQADLAQSSVMFGILIGSLIFGYLGDKYGRRKIVYMSPFVIALVTVIGVVLPEYKIYLILRLVAGIFCGGGGMIGFVMLTEVIGQSMRGFVGMMMPMCFAAGIGIFSLMAYFVREWKTLSLLTAVPSVAIGVYFYWILPESPRWLYSQGRVDEAERLLEQFAFKNSGQRRKVVLKQEVKTNTLVQPTMLDIIRHPVLRKLSLNNSFTWFVVCAVYYGLTLSASNLGGNIYISVALSGLVEVPAYFGAYILMERLGRRLTYCFSMLAGGLACLVLITIPIDNYKMRVILAVCGKMGISLSFCVAWLYAAEMYPTNVRNKALSLCNMMARIGGMICPMIVAYGKVHQNMDFVILGAMSVAASFVCLQLPETRGKAMPETIENLDKQPSVPGKVISLEKVSEISEEKVKLLESQIENNLDV